MALLTPRLLRRGLELFAVISVLGLVALVAYTRDVGAFVGALLSLHWGWVLLGVALATSDWVGGGLRLWVATRHMRPGVSLRAMILAAGMNAWAAYLTPSQTGGGPFMIWVMRRHGVPIPTGTIAAFVTFVATVIFFGIVGPLAIVFGAGQALAEHGIPILRVSVLDLFRASLGMFLLVGAIMVTLIVFPGAVRNLLHAVAVRLSRWKPRLADRLDQLRRGVDEAHDALVQFFRGRGWVALLGTVLFTAVAFANKLIAGYIVLRALGIPANFVDVLLVQTLVTFLLYFAPTPGGSGIAEILSAALMSIYVPDALLPSYTVLWRLYTSYLTVGVGSAIFWHWLRRGLIGKEEAVAGVGA